MPQDLSDDRSILVQIMAWCRQATSHYLSQCWLSSLLPYGVARPQWVNRISSGMTSLLSKSQCKQMENNHETFGGWEHEELLNWCTLSPNSSRIRFAIFCGSYVFTFDAETRIFQKKYCQTSNIEHTYVGNKTVDHSDVVGALPVGAAQTTSSFST